MMSWQWFAGVTMLAWVIAPASWMLRTSLTDPIPAPGAAGGSAITASTLLYALAFNLTFFIQELFLVLPKALLPGVSATLMHNNHRWQGEHPMLHLFQGTGALATLLCGLLCLWQLRTGRGRTPSRQLWLAWMAYCGVFMALTQVSLGALAPASDVGMAMAWLGLSPQVRWMAAALALAAMPSLAMAMSSTLLALAPERASATPRARLRWLWSMAVLPALAGTVLAIPFRLPRHWLEVTLPPLLVLLGGIAWLQAGALREPSRPQPPLAGRLSPVAPLGLLLALLAVFQLLLRPGIVFDWN